MSKSNCANITPKVIKWAREFCSLSQTDAAKKIGVKEIKLSDWENGVSFPTMSQAYKLASVYKFPLASLWLNEPPTNITIPKIRDFRRIYEHDYSHYSYELTVQIRDLTFKRELFLELSNNIGNAINPFNYKITITKTNIENVADNIRSFIGVTWELQKSWKDPRIAFNAIREIIETKNIAVYQLTDISVEECRGFSIYHNTLPIIALNRKDSYTGRLFTLIHELIHLTQSKSCIINIDSFDSNYESIDASEFLINEITAAVLIPSKNLNELIENNSNIFSIETIKNISNYFSISRESLVIRLYHLSYLSRQEADSLIDEIKKTYNKGKNKGFITPINDLLSKYGKPMAQVLFENYNKGYIHVDDFYSYTGLKEKHVSTLQLNI